MFFVKWLECSVLFHLDSRYVFTKFIDNNRRYYSVANGLIQLQDDQQLQDEFYNISTFAMKKTEEVKAAQGERGQESYEGIDYLFE